MKFLLLVLFLCCVAASKEKHCKRECLELTAHPIIFDMMSQKLADWNDCLNVHGNLECENRHTSIKGAPIACVDGMAGEYPCENIDLLSFIPHRDMTGDPRTVGNDMWGWTDPITRREYAIVCQSDGTSFVDITDAVNPQIMGRLPSTNINHNSWRDAKVYRDHVFIISEARDHGMQVFDLNRLRGLSQTNPIRIFDETFWYKEFGSCHNIAINEASGFAYAIGSTTCNYGPHVVDLRNPARPVFSHCFGDDGYTHDSECVIYSGPDGRFVGREICFHYNEDTLTIVDHSDEHPIMLSRLPYVGASYTHQGWLREGMDYLLLDDEADERRGNTPDGRTRTYIWDVRNLMEPVNIGTYDSPVVSIDHNQYIRGKYSYMSNYESGLRIVDISGIAAANLTEAAYFDVRPESNELVFNGVWSSYNYFDSGIVVSNSIERGLFVLRVNLPDLLL